MTNQPNNNGKPDETEHAATQLNQITKQLRDVDGLLRTQLNMLKQRGVNLPSGAMDNVRVLKKTFDNLSRTVGDSQQELLSLRTLADTTALINSAQKSDEVLNQVIDNVIALTGAERGYIVLKNRETQELEFKVARGMEQSSLEGGEFIISRSIVNSVADTGEAIVTDNAAEDPTLNKGESVVTFKLRSILAVPLKVRDDVIGVVYCDNRLQHGIFSDSELDVMNAFANQAAVAIENARLFESSTMRLEEVSELRDRMDNLFNSITSSIITIDNQGKVLVSNAAAQNLLGEQDMVGKTFADVMPMDDALKQAIDAVKSTEQQQMIECQPTVNGEDRIWSVIASPLVDDHGAAAGVAMVFDDLTEQKRAEARIKEGGTFIPKALMESFQNVDLNDMKIDEREITALFADVRGFTSFSENLEPEELMTVINKYLSLASDAINFFEGIVDKYMGDAVTGLYNTQLNPQPDHASRAVQAAMQLVLDLHAQHEVLPDSEQLFYGIGIHTGQAVLGNVGGKGRKEFAAFGEATDICKYLQEQAGEGEIIISEETYRVVEDQFECEYIPPEELERPKKGYEHIKCYRVVGRKSGVVADWVLDLLADDD